MTQNKICVITTKKLLKNNRFGTPYSNQISYFSVDLIQVCDGLVDCADKTDEIDCKMFKLDQTYLKSVPPLIPISNTTKSGFYVPLDLNVNIESVLDINEVGSLMQIQLQGVCWRFFMDVLKPQFLLNNGMIRVI